MDRKPAFAALLPLALLAACASPAANYPSLAIRDVERVGGSFAPAERAPLPDPAPAVLNEADALADAAADAHATFLAEARAAATTVSAARGASVGSESWARAEVALASLVAARSRTMVPLADLDRLYVAAAAGGAALMTIAGFRDTVQAQVAEEDAAIDRLAAALAR